MQRGSVPGIIVLDKLAQVRGTTAPAFDLKVLLAAQEAQAACNVCVCVNVCSPPSHMTVVSGYSLCGNIPDHQRSRGRVGCT